MRVQFSTKLQGATEPVVFDFISKLALNETISSAVVTASVYSGVDATPSGLLSGSATISGTKVSQTLTAGVSGTIYQLSCAATTSLGKILMLQGFLAVELGLV
jgi:hypothetical protein